MRVNLTHVALFVAFVDFGFGILSVPMRELLSIYNGTSFDAAAAFKFMFAAVENSIFSQICFCFTRKFYRD